MIAILLACELREPNVEGRALGSAMQIFEILGCSAACQAH